MSTYKTRLYKKNTVTTALRPLLFTVFALLSGGAAFAQTCQIVSPDYVCLGIQINFSVSVTGGTASSYNWDLDGTTSSQPAPANLYNTYGTKTITVTVGLSGGGSCQVTKNIVVHPLPVSKFALSPANNYCFYKNKVCITDQSTPGPTGNPIAKRIFLWDDGGADITTTPATSKVVCHNYLKTGKFVLVMEDTDNKGCIAKSYDTVKILPDIDAQFNMDVFVNPSNCLYKACFYNKSIGDTLNASFFIWDFGDGKKDSSNYKQVCHDYPNVGNYTPRLIIGHNQGCVDTFSANFNVNNPPIAFNLKFDHKICVGDTVTIFNDTSNPGAQYRWYLKDSVTGIEKPFAFPINPITNVFGKPGKYYIKLNILRDSCQKNGFDSIEVTCPMADFDTKNQYLCKEGDTTLFCDKSCYYKSYNYTRMWDFKQGEACTTDTKNGINATRNCRYSVDENPKHVYAMPVGKTYACYEPTLVLHDTVTGCVSKKAKKVIMGMPDLTDFELTHQITQDKYCTEPSPGAGPLDHIVVFKFNNVDCFGFWDVYLNFDSAANKDAFTQQYMTPPPAINYPFTSDKNGDVTVGLIFANGRNYLHTSCSDSVVLPNRTCFDTLWYHKMFNLMVSPNPKVKPFNAKACVPYTVTLEPIDTIQYNLTKGIWYWGDGASDTIAFSPTDTLVPKKSHTYIKSGIYTAFIWLTNSRGCEEVEYLGLGLGYQNFVQFDTIVCAGDTARFINYMSYFDKADRLWDDTLRAALGMEKIWWDFGDGNGFSSNNPNPKIIYDNPGVYHVRAASRDSTGCTDTFDFDIRVVGADANIKSMADTFYCNDNIIRFYDSSLGSSLIPGDKVVAWDWEFGDGKNTSSLQDPYHFYSSFGEKFVRLAVKSSFGCVDTTYKTLYIVGPVPKFEIVTDSIGCVPLTVKFDNTSIRSSTWIWYLGDTSKTIINTDRDTGLSFTYAPAGTYYVKLYGADSIYNPQTGNRYFCSTFYPDSPLVKKIIVIPYYKANFKSLDTVCQGAPVIFINTSDKRYDIFRWFFGTGDSLRTAKDTGIYTYQQTGQYRVDFKPLYTPTKEERLCVTDTHKTITVIPIKADFDVDPASQEPIFFFINKSQNAVRYEWDFGQPSSGSRNTSKDLNPSHNYKLQKGTFKVCLKSYNRLGCMDSICKNLTNNFEPFLFIPNVFTPAGKDTLNNYFDIEIRGESYYDLHIFNRWGELMFKSTEDGQGNTDSRNWNGKNMFTGAECPSGVYYVVFNYELIGYEKRESYHGTLTLLRE